MPAIDLDDIAQALEGVKRESDGQDDVERGIIKLPAKEAGDTDEGARDKEKILEDKKDQARRENTDDQEQLAVPPGHFFEVDAREVVDDDRDS